MAPHVVPKTHPYLLNPSSTTWIPPLPTCPSAGDQPKSTNFARRGQKKKRAGNLQPGQGGQLETPPGFRLPAPPHLL